MHPKKVAILMATYNGEKFLTQQLDSIVKQTYTHWCLYVLDDGSTDKTRDILQDYQLRLGAEKMQISTQANHGCAITFLRLVNNPSIQADYYAYADQDDIWDLDKLQRAISILAKQTAIQPQLYCSGARLIDENNQVIGALPLKKRALSFQHALVQCAATGNTMVFNQLGKEIIQKIGAINLFGNHDWWTYLVISACGGLLFYDPQSSVSYRLHKDNFVGFVNDQRKRYYRSIKRILSSDFAKIITQDIENINKIVDKVTPQNHSVFSYFIKARQGNLFKRLYYLYKSGVYRQEIRETLGVYFAQVIGKF